MEYLLLASQAAQFGLGFASNIFGASANRKAARATVAALQAEKKYNIGLLRQQKQDKYWTDLMSAWASGTKANLGSSVAGAIASNQQVLADNIAFQEQQYNAQISMAQQQAKQRFLGIF